MIKKNYIALLFVLVTTIGFSTEIKGFTFKPFSGKTVNLIQYKDYITQEFEILISTKVDTSGRFFFDIDLKETQQAIIQIEYLIGIIYLDPNQKYTIYFPPRTLDGSYKLTRNNVIIEFKTIPKNDINGLIIQFDEQYDQFLADNRYKVGRKIFHSKLDTFKREIKDKFKGIKNKYFINYAKYKIADLQLVSPSAQQKINKLSVYNTYIHNKKIDTRHETQMRFLMNFYEKTLNNQVGKTGSQLAKILRERPNYVTLDTILQKDYFFKMKPIRELVIAENLFSMSYNENYSPVRMLALLKQAKKHGEIKEITQITTNIINSMERLIPGSNPIPFTLINQNGDSISLTDLKGKYVYINFWAIWNKQSQAELDLFKKLKADYGEVVEFVSINIDSRRIKFDRFMVSHKQYDWNMLYFGGNSNLLDQYNIYTIPHYLLIDSKGKIVSVTALPPSPNGDFKSIEKTFFELKKKSRSNKRFIPGLK